MTDAVKMAIDRIKARFHPHYGIDGASDSKQLASDCQTLIAIIEKGAETAARAILLCDVKLPPSTTIRAGCSFDTLLLAMSAPGRPRHFDTSLPQRKDCRCDCHNPGSTKLHIMPCCRNDEPAADAGVTQGDADKKLLAHIVSWVHCPAIMSVDQVEQMIAAHRLQSVAAATAEKDAEIARLRAVIKHTADSIENGEGCWVNLYATMCCSGSDCGCQGSSHADLIVHDFRAALSEAREAGAKD